MELLYPLQLKQPPLFWKRLSLGLIKVLCGPVTFIHTSHAFIDLGRWCRLMLEQKEATSQWP